MLIFLSVATFIGKSGVVGDLGIRFSKMNLHIFGYVAYVYMPLLLYPLYRFFKSSTITFRRLELIVAVSLFFVALLILQSLILSKGEFGNKLTALLKNYIGYFGLWALDIFLIIFALLIASKRNIDLILKKIKHRLIVLGDIVYHYAVWLYNVSKGAYKHIKKQVFLCIDRLPKRNALELKKYNMQSILDLQTATQERIEQAQYNFDDVFIEQAFDEMRRNILPNATYTQIEQMDSHNTQIPIQDTPITSQAIAKDKVSHIHNATPQPQNVEKIHLEIVKASDNSNIEEFFKAQIAKHQAILQSLKSKEQISPQVSKEYKVELVTKESKKPIQAMPNEQQPNDKAHNTNDTTESKYTIPTPPPRPIDFNVFLPPKNMQKSETVTNENHKADYSQKPNHIAPTQSIDTKANNTQAQNVQNMDDKAPNDNLRTQPPQWTSLNPQIKQDDKISLNVKPNMTKVEIQSQINKQPTQQKEQKSPSLVSNEASFIDIREIPTQDEEVLNNKWADNLIQEIKPTHKNTHSPQPHHVQRVTELAENAALLNSLEYGKVQKISHFKLPSTSLLNIPVEEKAEIDESEIDRKIEDLLAKLKMFRIDGDIARTYSGPIVTTFEFRPAPHIKVSKILNLEDDLAMALRARSIRIQAPIPGKDVVGIEIPNNTTQTIYLREVLESDVFKTASSPLTIALGKDIVGNSFIQDLKKFPHLLIAGTTGSGKSVGINAMILSLLYKNAPDNLKLLMIDPKKVEFSVYADIPHLITPIITNSKKAISALNSAALEMDRRYELMSEMRSKDIDGYNIKAREMGIDTFPYLVIIIDELADLMMTGGKEVEFALSRIAQMGRASGVHIIVATQRPSVDVVTGLIKTNIPTRISYKVSSKIDSKVILDSFGAESLLGRGDMLFTPPGVGGVVRLHAPWNTEEEIEKVVSFIKSQQSAVYDKHFMTDENEHIVGEYAESSDNSDIAEAKRICLRDRKTSISYLQRQMSIGYNKAANIIEALEKEGFLSAPNQKGVREIIGS